MEAKELEAKELEAKIEKVIENAMSYMSDSTPPKEFAAEIAALFDGEIQGRDNIIADYRRATGELKDLIDTLRDTIRRLEKAKRNTNFKVAVQMKEGISKALAIDAECTCSECTDTAKMAEVLLTALEVS